MFHPGTGSADDDFQDALLDCITHVGLLWCADRKVGCRLDTD